MKRTSNFDTFIKESKSKFKVGDTVAMKTAVDGMDEDMEDVEIPAGAKVKVLEVPDPRQVQHYLVDFNGAEISVDDIDFEKSAKPTVNESDMSGEFSRALKNVNTFESFINESDYDEDDEDDEDYEEDDEDDEALNYSEAHFKMDKFLADDIDLQDEYYEILNSDKPDEEKINDLETHLENSCVDEDRFYRYAGKNATWHGFAEYIVKQRALFRAKK